MLFSGWYTNYNTCITKNARLTNIKNQNSWLTSSSSTTTSGWLVLILFPLIRALHAPKKLRHRFVRAPRLHHQKVRHVVRTFRTTTSRRVHVFPRLVASEHVVDALFIRDGNVRFRPVFISNGVRVRARFAEQSKRVVVVVFLVVKVAAIKVVVFFFFSFVDSILLLLVLVLLLLLDGEQVPAGWTKREHFTRRHARALSLYRRRRRRTPLVLLCGFFFLFFNSEVFFNESARHKKKDGRRRGKRGGDCHRR